MKTPQEEKDILASVIIGAEKYRTLNERSMHLIQTMMDACKEKKFILYKQNLAIKRMIKAIEKNDRAGIGSAWRDAQRWGSKAKLINLIDKDYAGSDIPTNPK